VEGGTGGEGENNQVNRIDASWLDPLERTSKPNSTFKA
jgi:hypothetical protein